LIVKDTGQRVVEMAVGFPKDKQNARGIVIAPLGILLQPGVQMKIDDREAFKFHVRFCDTAGCFAFIELNDKVLSAMKAGQKIVLIFQSIDGKSVNVELSLKDFAKALAAISQ
jgi:invasion protein IalB